MYLDLFVYYYTFNIVFSEVETFKILSICSLAFVMKCETVKTF